MKAAIPCALKDIFDCRIQLFVKVYTVQNIVMSTQVFRS